MEGKRREGSWDQRSIIYIRRCSGVRLSTDVPHVVMEGPGSDCEKQDFKGTTVIPRITRQTSLLCPVVLAKVPTCGKRGPFGKPKSQFDPFYSSKDRTVVEGSAGWSAKSAVVGSLWGLSYPRGCYAEGCNCAQQPSSQHRCSCFRHLGFGVVEQVMRKEISETATPITAVTSFL